MLLHLNPQPKVSEESSELISNHDSTISCPPAAASSSSSQEGGTNMGAEVVQMKIGSAVGIIFVLSGVNRACSRQKRVPPAD